MFNRQQFKLPLRNTLIACLAVSSLCGCTVIGSDKLDLAENPNVHDAIENATGPLQDMNLRRQEIPPLLKKASANPYGHKDKIQCQDIEQEVVELDALLGPEEQQSNVIMASAEVADTPKNNGLDGTLDENIANIGNIEMPTTKVVKESAIDGAGKLAHDTLMDTIRSHTSILPFRSIIRKVTGADRHQKRLEEAYQAGKLRRAFLKGLADVKFGSKCLAKPTITEAKALIPK